MSQENTNQDEQGAWLAASGLGEGENIPKYNLDAAAGLAEALSPLSDYMTGVYQNGEQLIGNFGDWAEQKQVDQFFAIAKQFGFEPVHQNEADVPSIYPDAVEIDIPRPLTRTQEDLIRTWNEYP